LEIQIGTAEAISDSAEHCEGIAMVNETRIKYFIVLAECLNFSRAAEKLYLSQQSLSAQISALEGDLGVALFRRTTRSVTLTPAGESFYQLILPFSQEYQRFLDTYSTQKQSKELKVSCLEDMNIGSALASAKDQIHRLDAQLRIRFTFHPTYQDALEGLDSGEYDLVVVPNATMPDDSRYITQVCSAGDSFFFFSADLPGADQIQSLTDVKNYSFFCGNKNNPARKRITEHCETYGFTPKFYDPGETPAIERMMIEAGEGIGFGDRHSLLFQDKQLRHIAYKQQANVLAVWNKQKHSRFTVAFAEALADSMAQDK
jgi:DNA-binding transcriptional LysR family regulator